MLFRQLFRLFKPGQWRYGRAWAGGTSPSPAPTVLGEEGAPSLSVNKIIAREFANPGDTGILYTITITNNGNLTAFDVDLTDTLPTGLSFADILGNTRNWELGDIAPGETKETNYKVNVADTAEAMIYTNTVQVSASNHEPVSAQASLEVKAIVVLAETGFAANELKLLLTLALTALGMAILLKRRRIKVFND